MLDAIFDDLKTHPGLLALTVAWGSVTVVWMLYCIKRDAEEMELRYATMDLLWKIWGQV